MSVLVIAWSMMAATCLTVALVYGGIWLQQRSERAHLYFALFALAIVGFGVVELRLMMAPDVATYARLQPRVHWPLTLAAVSIVGFVWHYFGTGRRWLAIAAIVLRLLVVLINLLLPNGINYARFDAVVRVPLLGDSATVVTGVASPWTTLGLFAWLVLLLFVADAARTLWRKGKPQQRWRVLWVGGSVMLLLVVGVSLSALIHAGLVRTPYLVMPMFLLVLAIMGYTLTLDVVRAAQLERQAAQQHLELAHLSRLGMLGELSGSIAHELNQPLMSILANAQAAQMLLERGQVPEDELRAVLGDIVEDDRRAGEIIRRLRAMLRKESLPFHPIDLSEVVHDVLRIMNRDLLNRGVSASAEVASRLPCVEGDRIQLQQVLMNMLINACEAMGEASAQRAVSVRAARSGDGEVEVCVCDSGPGIAAGEPARIFDPFVTTKADGTGLGLAVCRTIIEAHGGRVFARNNSAGGATVGFALPALHVTT